jgi:hemerythrin
VALLGKDAAGAAAALLPDLKELVVSFEAHLRSEEDHMQPIGRRYLPLAMHKQITAKVGRRACHTCARTASITM